MRRLRRFVLALLGVAAASLLFAAAADAHVTVTAPGATRGGSDQEITFHVPVEKDADTTALTIALPTDTPIASVDVAPIAGWTHTETSSKLATPIRTDDGDITSAVTRITWTATGGGLKPGEFGAFTILAGQLPDVRTLTFRALQTYSDGSVVRWIQTAAPGSSEEPDFPAPTLTLAGSAPAQSSASSSDMSGMDMGSSHPESSSASSSDAVPLTLSIIALVLAAGTGVLVLVSRVRRQ